MRALYECRLEDIGRHDRVKVECQCGRTALLPPDAFHGLPSYVPVTSSKHRLRCDSCGDKGKVDISVVWADYSSRYR